MDKPPANDPRARPLWEAFGRTRDEATRDRLIDHYLPLSKIIAAKLFGLRPDNSTGFEDYLQYARIGLIESVDRFDLTRNVPFEAYASHRIRGAVLNGLGAESEAAAQREFWRTHVQDRLGSLAAAANLNPERAALQDLIDMTVGLALGAVLDLDPEQHVDEATQANPYAAAELEQLAGSVRRHVEKLPERERGVIQGHYVRKQEFQAIALEYGVTKGRISQIHARALQRLREMLNEQPRINRQV